METIKVGKKTKLKGVWSFTHLLGKETGVNKKKSVCKIQAASRI
jgi:hypothetical protein